jgi:putative phosphoribosyl transferase
MAFENRQDAGRKLAVRLAGCRGEDVVVLGLPRGGVPVAFEVALALDAPLDVIIVRKLGLPIQPELAMGALGEDGVRVLNEEVIDLARVSEGDLEGVERRERAEVDRRSRQFRGDRPRVPLEGRSVIIIDDGIATGSTARAACRVARAQGARRVVLASPVAPPAAAAELRDSADEVVVLETPERFFAIGQWYRDFRQTADREVTDLLDRAADR